MATGRVLLPIPGGLPHASTGIAGHKRVASSGAAPTNGIQVAHWRMTFDQSTDEHWTWPIIVPGDWSSGGTLRFKWGTDVTSGNVIWKAALGPAIDSSDDLDTYVMNATSITSAIAVPGTSGQVREDTLAPDGTDMAAGRLCVVMLGRDADNASDTAAGDAWVTGVVFEYTI